MPKSKKVWSHWDMPVRRGPFVPGDLIQETYTIERKAIRTGEDVRAFITRWQAMWRAGFHGLRRTPVMFRRNLNHERVAEMLQLPTTQQEQLLRKPITPEAQAALCLLLPPLALHVFMTGKKFHAPTDIVWDQLFHEQTARRAEGGDE